MQRVKICRATTWQATCSHARLRDNGYGQLLNEEGGDFMTEENKKDIEETVEILKGLDKPSLAIVKSGAELLKARADLDKQSEPDKAG